MEIHQLGKKILSFVAELPKNFRNVHRFVQISRIGRSCCCSEAKLLQATSWLILAPRRTQEFSQLIVRRQSKTQVEIGINPKPTRIALCSNRLTSNYLSLQLCGGKKSQSSPKQSPTSSTTPTDHATHEMGYNQIGQGLEMSRNKVFVSTVSRNMRNYQVLKNTVIHLTPSFKCCGRIIKEMFAKVWTRTRRQALVKKLTNLESLEGV